MQNEGKAVFSDFFVFDNIGDVADITDEDVDNMYKILNYYIGSVDNFNEAHIKELIQMCTDCDFLYGH